MKLLVENLGRIRNAKIDIRPLTIFVGRNNTNKTWTAYSLFGILQALRWRNQLVPNELVLDSELDAEIRRIAARLRAPAGHPLQNAVFFRTIPRAEVFADLRRSIRLSLLSPGIRSVISAPVAPNARVTLEMSVEEMREGPMLEMRLEVNPAANSVTVEYFGDGVTNAVHSLGALEDLVRDFALARHMSVRCLPAERKLISVMFTDVIKDRDSLPRPFADFAVMLALAKTRSEPAWTDLLPKLGGIVGGRYESGESAITFQAPGGPRFPLVGSASLVKSFAGLAVFVQQAQRGDVLLIDEPEMNAHPRAQAETAELLALLAARGVTVIVTTHSPYFVEHVANLIEGASITDLEKRASLAQKLFLQDADALIPASSVATYGFEESADGSEVVVRELDDREARSIDWGTFSRVSDEVSNLYGEILDLEREQPK